MPEASPRGDADAEVDPLSFLLRTIISLEPAHVTLLFVIGSPREGQGQLAGQMMEGSMRREEMAEHWSSPADLLDPCALRP